MHRLVQASRPRAEVSESIEAAVVEEMLEVLLLGAFSCFLLFEGLRLELLDWGSPHP